MSERAQKIRESKIAPVQFNGATLEERAEKLFNWVLDLFENSDVTELMIVRDVEGHIKCSDIGFGVLDVYSFTECVRLFLKEEGYNVSFGAKKRDGGAFWERIWLSIKIEV